MSSYSKEEQEADRFFDTIEVKTKKVTDTNNITISTVEYEYLKERDLKLTSLEHAGVDNWEGYDYSIDVLEELKKV